jgi:methylglutaconyl-CoA hydratase
LISACDYALALPTAEVKLSEIAIGIGPFVIAPVLQRKIGTAALSELSLSCHSWKSVDWAIQKGLFAEILPTLDQLDKAVHQHAKRLASYAPEAVAALKKELWHNTDDWDHRLSSNAEITGRLLLSKQTQQTIQNIKNNQ